MHTGGRRILFYGNCQVQYIARVFSAQIAPFTGDTAQYRDINFADFNNPVHAQQFAEADVLVDQVFDVDDPIPAGLVNPRAVRLRIPNMRGDFYWPFGTRALHPRHDLLPEQFYYAHEYGDTFLNRMVLQNIAPEAAVRQYMAVDFTRQRNLPRIFELSMDRQRRRDRISGINVFDAIESSLRSEMLFISPGHPCERLLHIVARPVLCELAGGALAEQALAGQYHGFPHWRIAPIHPNAARVLRLNFISEHTRYLVYDEGYFTFAEYALRYMKGQGVAELREAMRRYGQLDPHALLELATAATKHAPTSPLAYRLCSQALRGLRRPAQMLDAALRALGLEPENPQNIIEVVLALQHGDDLAGAEHWARLAVGRFPREASVYNALCDVLLAHGNLAELARYAALAAALHPGHVPGLLRAARHMIAARQFDAAEQLVSRARTLEASSAEAAQLQTRIAQRREQAQAAERQADPVTARRRKDAQLHAQLGQLLLLDNDAAGAEGHYRQAVALDPDVAAHHCALAETLTRQGRDEEAAEVLRAAALAGQRDVTPAG